MSNRERAPLGFGDELDSLDPTTWTKPEATTIKPKPADIRKAAEAAGFRSREPANKTFAEPKRQRRRRTGRSVQFNIKTTQETIDAFLAVADKEGWGIGETFEVATKILIDKHKNIE